MEFNEKLQQLRKQEGLTQEQLAEKLFVSRTAVSKWESGKGYPNIETLKSISKLFSVSIDELLSGEKLITIAEKENNVNLKHIYNLILGVLDLMALIFLFLPCYANHYNSYFHSVNLFKFKDTTKANIIVYWILFILMIVIGIIEILLVYLKKESDKNIITKCSIGIHFFAICFFASAKEPYVTLFLFIMFAIKALILLKQYKLK